MPAKIYISLALALLLLALGTGNPFLRRVQAEPRVPAIPLVTQASHLASGPACPDARLRRLVVAVRRDALGQPVWELEDGRVARRNPDHDPQRPDAEPLLLVELPAGDGTEDHRAAESPAVPAPAQR
jgi:hypothetical protein